MNAKDGAMVRMQPIPGRLTPPPPRWLPNGAFLGGNRAVFMVSGALRALIATLIDFDTLNWPPNDHLNWPP